MSLRAIDFSRPRERVPRVGLVLLALGLLGLLAAAVCHQRWSTERDRVQREAELRAEGDRARQQAARLTVAAAPTPQQQREQRAMAERARPWMAVLRSVESATRDPVYLLSMNSDVSNQGLRLQAEAPSFEHALAYVQVLPDGVGLASAELLSHEQVTDAASGRQVVRFSVAARWGAR